MAWDRMAAVGPGPDTKATHMHINVYVVFSVRGSFRLMAFGLKLERSLALLSSKARAIRHSRYQPWTLQRRSCGCSSTNENRSPTFPFRTGELAQPYRRLAGRENKLGAFHTTTPRARRSVAQSQV